MRVAYFDLSLQSLKTSRRSDETEKKIITTCCEKMVVLLTQHDFVEMLRWAFVPEEDCILLVKMIMTYETLKKIVL